MNLLFGDNGNGKTNLVEAIFFLANLESHRSTDAKSLIKHREVQSTLVAEVGYRERNLLLAAEINAGSANKYYLNGNQQKRSSDFQGLLAAVIFAPEDLDLIRRDPADRRRFMDQALSSLKPRMAGVKADYERVLKQRNALLKSAKTQPRVDLSTLDIWDQQLVRLGTEITMARIELLKTLEPLIQNFYRALSSDTEEIKLDLELNIGSDDEGDVLENPDSDQIASMFHGKLQELRPKELERGVTLVGPHRDELRISKAGLSTRTHSSQGEAWSLALGLKLAISQLLRENSSSGDPVLILDDVFAVLDAGRRTRLLEFVSDYEQVLVTSADRASTPDLKWSLEISVGKDGELDQL
jgi:DNA replication and repair protein RecF